MSQISDAVGGYLSDAAAIERDSLYCGIDETSRNQIRQAAEEILRRPDLFEKLCAIDEALPLKYEAWNKAPWHEFPKKDSLAESFILAFPILRRVEPLRAKYAERGIPDEYCRRLMHDLQIWIETYAERTPGAVGFGEIPWLREHVCFRMFQFGRLQLQPSSWYAAATLLRNTATGEFVIVTKQKSQINRFGCYADCRGASQEGLKDLVYTEDESGVFGHRILPDCTVALAPEMFPFPLWEIYVKEGDPAIGIHIPAGTPLSPAQCEYDVKNALPFFKKYFPDWPLVNAKVLTCSSWLLYHKFADILPATSNIVAFQNMFMKFPIAKMGDWQFYERAFVPWGRNVRRENLKTKLQIALFDHIEAGNVPLEDDGVIVI